MLTFVLKFNAPMRGSPFSVSIEYPWKPQRCASCKMLEHHAKICPKFFRTQIPKKVSAKQKTCFASTGVPSGSVPSSEEHSDHGQNESPNPLPKSPVQVSKEHSDTNTQKDPVPTISLDVSKSSLGVPNEK